MKNKKVLITLNYKLSKRVGKELVTKRLLQGNDGELLSRRHFRELAIGRCLLETYGMKMEM